MKAIAYCRVSTANQREEGTIELQETAIKDFAASSGYEVDRYFKDEGISGGKELENRPALSEMFDYLEATPEVEAVIIYKLDRLARDLYIQEHLIKQLEKLGKKLISTKEPDLGSSDPMRKAFRQFMGIISELEKAFITMRLSGGRINKAKKGRFAGGSVAIGYRSKDKELIVDETQADLVRLIFNLKRRKRLSLHAIARRLTDDGYTTARGKKWWAGTVKYILENQLYKGKLEYSGIKSDRQELSILCKG